MLIYAKIFEPIKICHFLVAKYPKIIFLWWVDEKIELPKDAIRKATLHYSAFEQDFDAWAQGSNPGRVISCFCTEQKITLLPDGEKKQASVNTVAIATVITSKTK